MTITAKVIADSISPEGIRITSLQLRYPRFIHAEFMTHRVFSRNSSSSRAIPVSRLIEDIRQDTAMPIHWGKNQPGMQAREEHNEELFFAEDDGAYRMTREEAWLRARDNAIDIAEHYDYAGYHKQIVNRLLEPFAHINVLCTATEWDNFFELRLHEDAQPEILELAKQMKAAMDGSEPQKLVYGMWHLPYVSEEELMPIKEWMFQSAMDGRPITDNFIALKYDELIKLSVARCARVSYMTHDGKTPNREQDLKLYDRLVGSEPLHASPSEHQAIPLLEDDWSTDTKNFRGWVPYRSILENR